MEASLLSPLPAASMARPELLPAHLTTLFRPSRMAPCRERVIVALGTSRKPLALRASARPDPSSAAAAAALHKYPTTTRPPPTRQPQLFVGLPVDAVSQENKLNHAKAIAAGLKALKLLGADGVEVPIWWGVVENTTMGEYDWSAYHELAEMISEAGLQIHASLYFHASKAPSISLPSWVQEIGATNPDIYFSDKAGRRHKDCLSIAVDDLPIFGGKTPIQIYESFFHSFAHSFSHLMGSTITNVTIGLGPGGELRYPSLSAAKSNKLAGVGEFQCYDTHMLALLQQHADATGNHYWGRAGPHDAPRFDQTPESGGFFKDEGGSWNTPYGRFFLSWYSDLLLSHGDRVLSAANTIFGNYEVGIAARVPFEHSWYRTRSHALELTTGYYNADGLDGYDAVAEMLARHSCKMVVTGMDLADAGQPAVCFSSPESLLSQMVGACARHGVHVCGENTAVAAEGFDRIKMNILDEQWRGRPCMDTFTYQKMGASFFSPEHWPRFTEFVRSIGHPELHADDLPSDEEQHVSFTVREGAREMQTV